MKEQIEKTNNFLYYLNKRVQIVYLIGIDKYFFYRGIVLSIDSVSLILADEKEKKDILLVLNRITEIKEYGN